MPMIDGKYVCSHCRDEPADGFATSESPTHYPPDLEIEPTHLDIDLAVDIVDESATGTVTVTVVANRPDPRVLELDAVEFRDLEVESPEGDELHHTYDGEKIRVTWEEPFEDGEERSVAIHYGVHKPASGLFFSQRSDTQPDSGFWAATDHETERARHWLPCVDLPNVRTKLDFHLRAREDLTILANGELVGVDDHDDDTKTAHWRLDFPCPSYLVCFAIGEFTEADDGEFEGTPVAYYATDAHSEEQLQLSFGRTRKMLAWMTEKLGMAFPFPKYYQFALPGVGGAMENISLVSWDDIFVLDETLAEEWGWLTDQINVHEMAHTYFGDAVVCRDFAHAWLKESWATYMEQCWREDDDGEDWGKYDYYLNGKAYFEEADNSYKRPIVTRTFDHSWDMYDRHLYPGGACRLHTLRHELGDDVFWEGVRDYLHTYAGDVVETDDFRRVMEKHSGRSLGKFFDQWFFTAAYPDLKAGFSFDKEKSEGTFTLEQKQAKKDDGGVDESLVFDLRLQLGWTIDGEMHVEEAHLTQQKQTFIFEMEDDPQMVRVDPNAHVLHKLEFNPGDDKLKRQLTEADDVIGRILAARELADTGKRSNLEAVAEAYRDEPFWGVRKDMAMALADAGTSYVIKVLGDLIAVEDDPMVYETLLRAAAKFRDGSLVESVQRRLPELRWYRARGAAYELLGAQRDDADVDQLVEAAESEADSYKGHVQSGVFRALAATRASEAVDVLIDKTAEGNAKERARAAGAIALGSLGLYLEKRDEERIREHLEDLLTDDAELVAWSAAAGLTKMFARDSIGALESYRATLPRQQQVVMKRKINAIRKGDSEKIKSLETQLDEVREKFRKLEERLEKLED